MKKEQKELIGQLVQETLFVPKLMESKFKQGDLVSRNNSDYVMLGTIVSVFTKLDGKIRYVVEDDRGTLFIQSDKTLIERKA